MGAGASSSNCPTGIKEIRDKSPYPTNPITNLTVGGAQECWNCKLDISTKQVTTAWVQLETPSRLRIELNQSGFEFVFNGKLYTVKSMALYGSYPLLVEGVSCNAVLILYGQSGQTIVNLMVPIEQGAESSAFIKDIADQLTSWKTPTPNSGGYPRIEISSTRGWERNQFVPVNQKGEVDSAFFIWKNQLYKEKVISTEPCVRRITWEPMAEESLPNYIVFQNRIQVSATTLANLQRGLEASKDIDISIPKNYSYKAQTCTSCTVDPSQLLEAASRPKDDSFFVTLTGSLIGIFGGLLVLMAVVYVTKYIDIKFYGFYATGRAVWITVTLVGILIAIVGFGLGATMIAAITRLVQNA